jgi:hypothetical protein
MYIIITEQQLNNLREVENIKKTLFKFWDNNGGYIDNSILSMFGFKGRILNIGNITISENELYNWLIDWRGENKSIILVEKFLNQNPHKIENCGGYEFEFDVFDYKIHDRQVDLVLRVNDKRGRVALIFQDGQLWNLKDARNNEDFGWEIDGEIQDCLYEYFLLNLSDKTGFDSVFERIDYTSDGEW